ncbi:MAG TPA: cation transporter [Candidatus Cloacimonetes bacterium]|nr:cation transporter [Candidatus Cloacimonadota bacterium]
MKKEKKSIAYLEAGISILLNIILFILKYIVGIKTASIAIIADAWHTLSDSFSSIILFFGIKISNKPPDKEHPFGHGRAEIIASLIIGIILTIVAFNFLIESFQRFREHQAANFSMKAIIIIIISIVLKEFMAQFSFWGARKTKSTLLSADGWHHRSDALTSLMVLIGIFLGKYFWWIDSVMGFLLSLMIFYAAFNILKKSISPLIGEEPDEEIVHKIKEIINTNIDQEIHFHHLHYHCYGSHKEITFHIVLAPDMKLVEAHNVADKIEKLIKSELDIEATIHAEPYHNENLPNF